MIRLVASLVLIFAIGSGVFAGVPVHSGNSQMMKCCDKAKSKDKAPEMIAAQICCVFNCNDSAPTSSSASFNFLPSTITVNYSILKQIAALLKKEKVIQTPNFTFEREVSPREFLPKYIQHNSFLI